GLARSSRNVYLSTEEKTAALVLSRSLNLARKAFDSGETRVSQLKKIIVDEINSEPMAVIDYVEIYSFPALEEIDKVDGESIMAIAVKIGKTRLIDNVILEG
ncbi:pantoate--beta-alanine ligase, partial [uncultured Anaerovibrio sp.]|uniref:pantoate--beta-alanine ligase n=1 Tax=uncultured Anaerovibrio sp. TaxID=361586 RepID=UPI0026283CCA